MLLGSIALYIALFMVWISILCYGMYRGLLRQGIEIPFLKNARYELTKLSLIPFIISLILNSKTLFNLPEETIEVLILYLFACVVIFFSTSFIPGYCIGYFLAKSGRF